MWHSALHKIHRSLINRSVLYFEGHTSMRYTRAIFSNCYSAICYQYLGQLQHLWHKCCENVLAVCKLSTLMANVPNHFCNMFLFVPHPIARRIDSTLHRWLRAFRIVVVVVVEMLTGQSRCTCSTRKTWRVSRGCGVRCPCVRAHIVKTTRSVECHIRKVIDIIDQILARLVRNVGSFYPCCFCRCWRIVGCSVRDDQIPLRWIEKKN